MGCILQLYVRERDPAKLGEKITVYVLLNDDREGSKEGILEGC
jgi:hypothetical protein